MTVLLAVMTIVVVHEVDGIQVVMLVEVVVKHEKVTTNEMLKIC